MHFTFFFFSKIDRTLYKLVRLMYGSGSALCFIAIKIGAFLFNELYRVT